MTPTMGATSAGLLLYRIISGGAIEVLIAHPGGPFWARKDDAAWSVPKGEYQTDENPLQAAYREFEEEVGLAVPEGRPVFLGERRQPGGKRVSVWALEGDLDITHSSSNTFELEWPRGSGKIRAFPEVDRVEWMSIGLAERKLVRGQAPFLLSLREVLGLGVEQTDAGSTTPVDG
jgi:predicted NUDIX family NTP pyrophosphohydrolase